MTKLSKVAIAYLIASSASLVTGWVGALVWAEWTRTPLTTWSVAASVWLFVVGVPSMFAAAKYLLKSLGVREWPTAWLAQRNTRLVPIGLGSELSYSIPTVVHMSSRHASAAPTGIEIPELEIRAGHYIISHTILLSFLRSAWARQRQGQDGLSRSWWVENGKQLERGEYEAIIQVLLRQGLIRGRSPGRSGKLLMPPASTLHYLEERL